MMKSVFSSNEELCDGCSTLDCVTNGCVSKEALGDSGSALPKLPEPTAYALAAQETNRRLNDRTKRENRVGFVK
jgi:hypothetical protein